MTPENLSHEQIRYLTPSEVADMFRVDPKTVSRWDKQDRFLEGTVTRTLGGHRRYREDLVLKVLAGEQ